LRFNVGWLSGPVLSWNHTKIIVIDQKFALQGGHNWWDKDYLGLSPVQDLSMFYEGRALELTTDFIDNLWKSVKSNSFYAPDGERFPPFSGSLSTDPVGDVATMAMGRMGVFGDNSSDEGLAALIDSAENELLIAQQDMFNFTTLLAAAKSFVEANLFHAVLRGVKISIVQSNKEGLNYGMVPAAQAIKTLRQDFVAFVKIHKLPLPSGRTADEYFCNTVFYAPMRYSTQCSTWANNSPLSLHSKLVIADRAAFYLGSHNLYPANLQEFGLVIFDPDRTREVLEQFWDPLYQASTSARSTCL